MALTAAQLLDELMGRDRNLVPGEKSSQVPWDHEDVCRSFLCGFCPHDLFVNTKADLGTCTKIHDDQLKSDYEKSSRYGKMGFEEDFTRYLGSIQGDVDRRIRRGHERLLINQAREQELSEKDSEKTKMLTDHINKLLEEIEQLGSEGKVEEAQGVARLVEQLKEEREQSKQNHSGVASQEKQMEVCEVCGAFLIVGDAQSRVDDHLQGKQHVGYAKIKSTLDEMKNRSWERRGREKSEKSDRDRDERDSERSKRRERSGERKSSRKSRSKSRDRRRDKSRERRRSRDKRDERRSRHGSRDRDRDRSRRDSRRSSRRSRSRSKDRRRRSRSRERSKDRRSRHGSRDRDRRERKSSKERERRTEDKMDKGTAMVDSVEQNGTEERRVDEGKERPVSAEGEEKGINSTESIDKKDQTNEKAIDSNTIMEY